MLAYLTVREDSMPSSINQSVIEDQMMVFLKYLGESLPHQALRGCCNAHTIMRIRAGMVGQLDQYLDRLHAIAELTDYQLKIMGKLLKAYRDCYGVAFQQTQDHQQAKKLATMIAINKVRQASHWRDDNGAELLAIADDFYVFIQTFLFVQSPGIMRNAAISRDPVNLLIGEGVSERLVEQDDVLEIIRVIAPDGVSLNALPIQQALKFAFNFTEQELAATLDLMIFPGDLIQVAGCNRGGRGRHGVFLTKSKNNKYYLCDSNHPDDFVCYSSSVDLAKALNEVLFIKYALYQTHYMPIQFNIFEKANHQNNRRPTEDELVSFVLSRRDGKNDQEKINRTGPDGITVMHLAAQSNNLSLIKAVLDRKAKVNVGAFAYARTQEAHRLMTKRSGGVLGFFKRQWAVPLVGITAGLMVGAPCYVMGMLFAMSGVGAIALVAGIAAGALITLAGFTLMSHSENHFKKLPRAEQPFQVSVSHQRWIDNAGQVSQLVKNQMQSKKRLPSPRVNRPKSSLAKPSQSPAALFYPKNQVALNVPISEVQSRLCAQFR